MEITSLREGNRKNKEITHLQSNHHKNILVQLIEKYPDKPWNWSSLSYNPNITLEIVEKYPDKLWNWYYVCRSPGINFDIVDKYPPYKLDWDRLSQNPVRVLRIKSESKYYFRNS